VAPLVAVTVPVMISFVAISVDYGYVAVTKSQLQNAADAAALAGASAYYSNAGIKQLHDELTVEARDRAKAIAVHNRVCDTGLVLADTDVQLGKHDYANRLGALSADSPWNAVHVTARRTAGSPSGPAPLFFARIFGQSTANVAAHARAVANDRAAGYRLLKNGLFIPFTIHTQKYQEMLANGTDGYSYDGNGNVTGTGDGVREIKLFPWKWSTLPDSKYNGSDGAGNFGTLTVGLGSQGTSFLEEQIRNGITADELQATFGTTDLIFYDEEHTAETGPRIYHAPGNPGLSAGFRDAVEAKIGDVIGFFIHNGVTETGSNADYSICNIAFGRIMDIKLTGNKNNRSLTVQPVSYFDDLVRVDENAPSTNGLTGHVGLVQ
jgi:hypothetical protein